MAKQSASKHISRMIDMTSAMKEHLAYLTVDPEWSFDQTMLNMFRATLEVQVELLITLLKFAVHK